MLKVSLINASTIKQLYKDVHLALAMNVKQVHTVCIYMGVQVIVSLYSADPRSQPL